MAAALIFLLTLTSIFSTACAQDTQHADSINNANTQTIRNDGPYLQQAIIAMDSTIQLTAYLGPNYKDYRMIGYADPDTLSQKMILISIFTSDVEDNPFNCPFGAYYGTGRLYRNRHQRDN